VPAAKEVHSVRRNSAHAITKLFRDGAGTAAGSYSGAGQYASKSKSAGRISVVSSGIGGFTRIEFQQQFPHQYTTTIRSCAISSS